MLGFFWRTIDITAWCQVVPRENAMYYYLLPIESMAGAIQFVFYFFTMLAAAIAYMIARQ